MVTLEHLHAVPGDGIDVLAEGGAEFGHKSADQQGDVLASFAERRHCNGEDIQPVVEILPELPFANRPFEVLIGSCDNA